MYVVLEMASETSFASAVWSWICAIVSSTRSIVLPPSVSAR